MVGHCLKLRMLSILMCAITMVELGCETKKCTAVTASTGISSPNYGERNGSSIRMIVIHYTAIASLKESLARLTATNDGSRVSAHYLVDRNGDVYNMVDESKRAWHAGRGSWVIAGQRITDVNSVSIGIELVNAGLLANGEREPYPADQIDSLIALCKDIMNRYGINPTCIVGHSDVAPVRKQDPGEGFPWKKLAESGIGVWSDEFIAPDKTLGELLKSIGYEVDDEEKAITAFQRHFYPEALTEGALRTEERAMAVSQVFALKRR